MSSPPPERAGADPASSRPGDGPGNAVGSMRCRGRFAPSPTGPLHFGSVVAALASFLEARARGGEWLVRVDDLDTARNVAGATGAILHELDRLGLHWDGEVARQSARGDRYAAALEELRSRGCTFACACTRREVGSRVYPGTCRNGVAPGRRARAIRVRADAGAIAIPDRVQGLYRQDLRREVGDFIVYRADGVVAYHLASAVDDAELEVTCVVRGVDLLASTPRQAYLQDLLGQRRPEYAHVPVVTDRHGNKLGKQTRAPPTHLRPAGSVLRDALGFLAHPPPPGLAKAPPQELLAWALGAWTLERVPRVASRGRPDAGP